MSATIPSEPAPASKVMPRGTATSRLATVAIVLSSLVFAVPITTSAVVEGLLDQINPAGVKELDNGVAYLGEILGWSFGALGVLLVALIVVYAMIYRRERTLDTLKLPLIIVAIQIVLGVVSLIFNALAR